MLLRSFSHLNYFPVVLCFQCNQINNQTIVTQSTSNKLATARTPTFAIANIFVAFTLTKLLNSHRTFEYVQHVETRGTGISGFPQFTAYYVRIQLRQAMTIDSS